MTRGLLITLEGIDGCGKTTQAGFLRQRFADHGITCCFVREPGGTAVGEDIRQVLLDNRHHDLSLQSELLLYMAARSELIRQIVIPALIRGEVILCDRFTDSTLAYQGYGGGADLTLIRSLNEIATGSIKPNLTILFDLETKVAITRRTGAADRIENRNLAFHNRVRRGYLTLAEEEGQRIKVIDASLSREDQGDLVWSLVAPLISQPSAERPGYELT